MSLESTSIIIIILIITSFKGATCHSVLSTNISQTKIDLQSFLDDLSVTAHTMHYTVSLNSRLLEELKKRLQSNELSCESSGSTKSEQVNDFTSKDTRIKYFHVRDKTYGLLRTPQTWNEARKSCLAAGGKLADVQNEVQGEILGQNFERLKVKKAESVYVGIHSLFGGNDWVTVNGEPVAATLNLALVQQNSTSYAGKNCGVLSGQTIDKVDCDNKLVAICLL